MQHHSTHNNSNNRTNFKAPLLSGCHDCLSGLWVLRAVVHLVEACPSAAYCLFVEDGHFTYCLFSSEWLMFTVEFGSAIVGNASES